MRRYYLYHAVYADMLECSQRSTDAMQCYVRVLALVGNGTERDLSSRVFEQENRQCMKTAR